MSEVVFDGVTKRFGDVTAVDRLDLDVLNDEFMVLLGPSGCGKTTALRMIAGLETATEGTLRIGDRVVNDVEAKDRNVSMVFQSYALYPHMTVAKNIESPLLARKVRVPGEAEPRKLTKAERAEQVGEAARTLGLSDLLDRKPAALSGGQRQRVALGRAIVSQPDAFLMDEPLSNLDAKLRAQTRLELVALHERVATTFLYVTHDQVEAMTMATRIAVMSDGSAAAGRPAAGRLRATAQPLRGPLHRQPADEHGGRHLRGRRRRAVRPARRRAVLGHRGGRRAGGRRHEGDRRRAARAPGCSPETARPRWRPRSGPSSGSATSAT